MNSARLITLLSLLLALLAVSTRADAVTEWADPAQAQRFQQLTEQLRCLVCQNQTLWDSHADLALDLKQQVRQQLQQGKSDAQIIDFMVARYGDFVLYRPPLKSTTGLLWFGPLLLLLGGLWLLGRRIRQQAAGWADEPTLDEETP